MFFFYSLDKFIFTLHSQIKHANMQFRKSSRLWDIKLNIINTH